MYTTIINAETLKEHLSDPDWIVIDCRHSLLNHAEGRQLFDAGHIPGAQFVYVETDLSAEKNGTNGRHPLPQPEAFAEFLRSIGVNERTQIVAYDAGIDMFASRLWFMARWIGHAAVALLDGGYAGWLQAGYAVSTEPAPQRKPGDIQAHDSLEETFSADEILRGLDPGSYSRAVLLDARGNDRFHGQNETMDPIAGHIPGAHNRFFKENFAENGQYKSADVLKTEFAQYGDPKNIVHYCGSGVSSAVNLLAMHIAGLQGAGLYPGSWSEWSADASRPTAT